MAKRKRGKPAKAEGGGLDAMPQMDGEMIVIPTDPEGDPQGQNESVKVDPTSGMVVIEHEDGSITIDTDGSSLYNEPEGDPTHDENLANKIDPGERARIAEMIYTHVEDDKQDRNQWLSMRAKVIELLGIKLEDPKGDVSRSTMGMSTSSVRDPTMLMAVNMFRANTYGELCPSTGPVKVKIASPKESLTSQENADALQADLNHYLMTTASEYYPDMYYMLWWTGLVSGTFKKVYHCPLRNRPVSQFIDGTKLIVSDNTDLKNSARITHEVEMDKATMKAMQLRGVYRSADLGEPMSMPQNTVDAKKAQIAGMGGQPRNPEDEKFTLYETYLKLDIKGYEHKVKGKVTGLPLPYKVTMDTGSREILEIRRNWEETDEDQVYLEPMIPFIAFPFSTGLLRTYGTGLGHEMGNMASALTALLRISIDNGILGNYPGVIKGKGPGRDVVNEIMVPPGGAVELDTGGLPIQQFVMPLPYKDVSGAVMQLIEQTRGAAKELGGTAMMPVGEGRADIPVGTMLAMIEQALKPLAAVHKMLCAAQAEEMRQLVRLFQDDPEALWRGNKRPQCGKDMAARMAVWKQALEDCDIEPVADPNVPSEMHRKLMAMALKQLTEGNPAYDQVKIDRWIARQVLKMPQDDFDQFLAPAPDGGPTPEMLDLMIKKQKADTDQVKVAATAQLKSQELELKKNSEIAKLAVNMAGKSEGGPVVEPIDPLQVRALDLKEQQLHDNRAKMMIDAHNKKLDREAKVTTDSLKIAQAVAVHPESEPLVDEQLAQMAAAGYTAPLGKGGPSSEGGRVKTEEEHDTDHHAESLASQISKALMERMQQGNRPLN